MHTTPARPVALGNLDWIPAHSRAHSPWIRAGLDPVGGATQLVAPPGPRSPTHKSPSVVRRTGNSLRTRKPSLLKRLKGRGPVTASAHSSRDTPLAWHMAFTCSPPAMAEIREAYTSRKARSTSIEPHALPGTLPSHTALCEQ